MAFPVEQRFKLLAQQYADAELVRSPAQYTRPEVMPGVVVGFQSRSDTGYFLTVLPLFPTGVTSAGELTFPSYSDLGSLSNRFVYPVYPTDCKPSLVKAYYNVGQYVTIFPYWAAGTNKNKVRGTYVCQDADPNVLVEITSNTAIGGQYQGTIQVGWATDIGLDGITNTGPVCLVVNGPERADTEVTPLINNGVILPGIIKGTDANTGDPIVVLSGFSDVLCNGSGSGGST